MIFRKYSFLFILLLLIIFNSCSAEFTDNNDNNINLQPNELESDNQIMTDFSTIGFIESFLKNGVSGSISRSLSKETQAIIDDLIAKDAVDPFIDQMVYNFGYPSWQNILL
ncbi:MAG: PBP1b-binding outer membrane lipoprotein LpoB, partial [Saprospiraceae bacterium]